MRQILVPLLCAFLSLPVFAQQGKADVTALREQAQASVEAGKWVDAAATFRKLTEAEPKDGRNWHMLGYCLHAAGQLDEALPVHVKATEFKDVAPVAAYNVACVHALKGDKEKALEWLEKAAGFGFAQADHLAMDTDMDVLRSDPRFAAIAKKIDAAAAAGGAGKAQLYVVSTPRQSARVALFDRKGSPGQLALDYGVVKWQAKYDQAINSPQFVGKKWRFGSDAWTSLDTAMPVVLGGKEIAAGYYYLTIEHKGDRKFVLAVHDAAAAKLQHLDAFQAHKLTGGIEVPLDYNKAEAVAEELKVVFEFAKGAMDGKLVVHFGGHQLTTSIGIKAAQ